jgi:hypothetical protein
MKWFINRKPRFFAFVYLFLIVGFAGVYCFLPNQLYQSNRNFEKYNSDNKEQKDFLYDEILREATDGIVERFNNKFADTFIVSNNYSMYSGTMRITDFKFESGYFIFTLVSNPYNLTQLRPVILQLRTELSEPLSVDSNWGSRYKGIEYKKVRGDDEAVSFVLNVLFSSNSLKDLDDYEYGIPPVGGSSNTTINSGTNTPIESGSNTRASVSNPGVPAVLGGGGSNDISWHSFIYDDMAISGSNTGSGTAIGSRSKNDSMLLGQFAPKMDKEIKTLVYRKYFFDKVFPSQNLDFENNTRIYHFMTFPITENLNNNLKSFALGLTDDPNTIAGKLELFLKMLYFSIISIATLGYGDIVPITTLARFLVSAEVILGILTIGLFLNSLATRITKKNN